MLRPRIIPCLLIRNGGLVKTVRFAEPKYVGDPLNAVRIFNEKEVDELIAIDIDATVLKKEPNYSLIESLAAQCRMPLCYAGGVKRLDQIERIISLGVEKVALSSSAIQNPELVAHAAGIVGSQSVVVVLDIRRKKGPNPFELYTNNGRLASGVNAIEFAKQMEDAGAGEIVLNSIDMDGTMQGYDIDLIRAVRTATTVPMTALGGARSLHDISDLFKTFGIIGAAAGSLFVFKGKYRAVLISYPSRTEKESLFDGTVA